MSAIACLLCRSLSNLVSVNVPLFGTDESKAAHAKLHFEQMRTVLVVDATFDGVYGRCFLEDIGPSRIDETRSVSATRKGRRKTSCEKYGSEDTDEAKLRHANFELSSLCRRLLHGKDRTATIICGICNCRLKLFGKEKIATKRVIDHARLHAGECSFECVHCGHKAVTYGGIARHILAKHGSMNGIKDYRDFTPQCVEELKTMLDKCFGDPKVPLQDSAHSNIVSRNDKLSSRSLLSYCRSLLSDKHPKSGVPCAECGVVMKVFRQTGSVMCDMVINHATMHLKKDIFACRHCDLRYSSRSAVTGHLRGFHSLSATSKNFTDLSKNYQIEIRDMLKRCFGQPQQTPTPTKESNASRTLKRKWINAKVIHDPLSNFCRQSILTNWKGNFATCSKCGSILRFRQPNNAILAASVIDHARIHVGQPMFKCGLCNYESLSKSAMQLHFWKSHKGIREKQFTDSSSAHTDAIMKMLEECFGRDAAMKNGSEEKKQTTPSSRTSKISTLLSRTAGNPKLAELRMHMYTLMDKYGDQKAGIRCRMCGMDIKSTLCQRSIQHAMTHVGKPLYRCRLCQKNSETLRRVRYHIRYVHKVSPIGNFDDNSNDFHDEIMTVLSKCYDHD